MIARRMMLLLTLCGKDYYRLLRIPKDADIEVIKKAYRKEQLRFHPDRAETEDDRIQSENKIFDLNEAIDVLTNPEKRKIYDDAEFTTGFGEEAIHEYENHREPEIYKKMPHYNPESPMFNPNIKVDVVEKAPPIVLDVELSFVEAMNGIIDTVSYDVLEIDSHCNGTGAEDGHFHICPECEGRGQWVDNVEIMPGIVGQLQKACTVCNATGRIIERACNFCGGSGVVKRERSVLCNLQSGIYDNYSYIEENVGSITPQDLSLPPGDLEVRISVISEVDHKGNHFERHGQDIIVIVRIPLLELLFGIDFDLELPNGHAIRVFKVGPSEIGDLITIKGMGFGEFQGRPDGDLIVQIGCEIPRPRAGITEEEIASLFE